MNFKECRLSAEGFVLPDFDFDSVDAVFPVSTPPITPYVFNTRNDYYDLVDSIKTKNTQAISKCLKIFKSSVISNSTDLPLELFMDINVPKTLMALIDPKAYPDLLYDSICAAVAWTGAQSKDSENFNNNSFIYFLIETTVTALSDPNFPGDKKIGNASLALLRNLVYNSNNIRILFIKMRGIELFTSLYLEIINSDIDLYILWTLQNSLLVQPPPPYNYFQHIEKIFRSTFTLNMKNVDPSEIRLAIAYAKCGPDFAKGLMTNTDFGLSSTQFVTALPETQILLFELFETLSLYPDPIIQTIAFERINWNEFLPKIPKLDELPFLLLPPPEPSQKASRLPKLEKNGMNKIFKKFISMASHFFTENYEKILDTPIIKVLIRIFEKTKYSIKLQVIGCLSLLINSSDPKFREDAINSILFNKVLPLFIKMLDDTNSRFLKFALENFLFVIRYAQSHREIQPKLIEQLDDYEFGPIIEEFFERDLKEDVHELASIVLNEYTQLSDNFDEQQAEAENEDEDNEREAVDYSFLARNHQNPQKGFGSYSSDEEDFMGEDEKLNVDYHLLKRENQFKESTESSEEDEWIDVDM